MRTITIVVEVSHTIKAMELIETVKNKLPEDDKFKFMADVKEATEEDYDEIFATANEYVKVVLI